MSAPRTLRSLQWRYGLLLVLRWLPIGFVAPLLVLVFLSRDLSLGEVGPVMAGYSLVTLLAEIPTGGLADAHGRRRILVVSSLLQATFLLLVLVLDGVLWMTVAAMIGGASRALDSGPLEAWFVDSCRAVDRDVDIERRLARGSAVDSITLAVGAVAGGLIGSATGGNLDAVVAVALAAQTAHALAVLVLMRESTTAAGVQRATTREAIQDAIRLVRSGQGLTVILLAGFGVGVALTSIEILFQPRFDELVEGDAAPGLLGAILAASFIGAALGSEVGPELRRRLGWSARRFLVLGGLVQACCFLAMAAAGSAAFTAAGMLAFYTTLGMMHPVESSLFHDRVTSTARTTMLSARSSTLQTGGFLGSLSLPALAATTSVPTAWVVAAVVTACAGLLYLRLPTVADASVALSAQTPASRSREFSSHG